VDRGGGSTAGDMAMVMSFSNMGGKAETKGVPSDGGARGQSVDRLRA
jgi:hypothetical protein